MTVNDRSTSRLIVIGTALIAAAALVVLAGVIPRVLSDTFAEAAPSRAAAAFRVHLGITAFVVLALLGVTFGASARPRLAVPGLRVLGTAVFILGMFLVMPGMAFLGHGPGMRGVVVLLFSAAAAVFVAGGLVLVAASRLAGYAARQDPRFLPSWKGRLGPAILLSLCSVFVLFLLGEIVEGLESSPAFAGERPVVVAVLAVGMGAYFFLSAYGLLRRLPRSRQNLWVVLILNAAFLVVAIIVLVVEPNRSAGLQMLGVLGLSAAASLAGLALAARS